MGLTTKQALKILQDAPDRNYIYHNDLTGCTIHNESGDELGKISGIVFNRLLQTDMVKFVSKSKDFWSNGYFRIKSKS